MYCVQWEGRRCSTGRAYIRRVWGYRTNLHVSPHSYVTKILIDPITKRTYGIVFAKDKKYYVAVSKNEIIISAGVFGSLQILMLSGIGPSRHLTNLGIPIIQDLPVGMALQDHFSYTGLQFHSHHSDEIRGLNEMVNDYLKFKGALTDVYADAVAFVQTNLSTTPNHPDIEIVLYDFKAPEYNVQLLVNFERTFHVRTILLRPKSQGSLRLRSSDPFEYPLINPNIFSDNYNEDMETMYQGIQLALQLSRTKSFKELDTKLIHVHVPDCKNYPYFSKPYWYCHMKYFTRTFGHGVGTCKMGPDPIAGAVVDHKLRVHGISNLIVADASVIPSSTSGHTSALSMMIGERAAHIIRYGKNNP